MQTPVATHQTATPALDEARKLYEGRTLDFLNAWRGMVRAGITVGEAGEMIVGLARSMGRIMHEARR